jgi:signal peptidase I
MFRTASNWELLGWGALIASGLVILASLFIRRPAATAANADAPHSSFFLWLEIAWPVFFIAVMAMLSIKEVMGFAAVLLLATVITGTVWLIDALFLKKSRTKASGEPILVEMAKSFFPVILIVFLLRSFLYEPFKIPSGSMVPTLLVGDFILVNKFTYGIRLPVINKKIVEMNAPKRGDVMVFRYPEDPAKDFIKRIIGIPGDTVSYQNKRLTINGEAITTEKVGLFTDVDERMNMRQFEVFNEKVGEKNHTMMVDNNYPVIGLSSVRQFTNKKNCAYNETGVTCKVPDGHYFMMGDSRDNSDDSRYWGFVPEENIVGKAVLVWMNFGAFKRVGTSIE